MLIIQKQLVKMFFLQNICENVIDLYD